MSAPNRIADPAAGRPKLTDSPWFWLLLFANAALIGGVVIAPKYGQRQAGLERRFEVRQEVARRKAAGELPASFSDESAPPLPTTRPQIVRLGPLIGFLAVVNLVALYFFRRRVGRPLAPPASESSPGALP